MGSGIRHGKRRETRRRLQKIMKCLSSGEPLRGADEMVPSSESLAAKEYSAGGFCSQPEQVDKKPDTGNIEEAESSLRESGFLNYEEARSQLGRYDYQKGNIKADLHVFEGIDICATTPKIKIALARTREHRKRHSQNYAAPQMSIHAVGSLLEAVFLKAKSLQKLPNLAKLF